MPKHGASSSQPMNLMRNLTLTLTNSTPNKQRTMPGKTLCPLVEKLEPDAAAKLTRMLLEMDHTTRILCFSEDFVLILTKHLSIVKTINSPHKM